MKIEVEFKLEKQFTEKDRKRIFCELFNAYYVPFFVEKSSVGK